MSQSAPRRADAGAEDFFLYMLATNEEFRQTIQEITDRMAIYAATVLYADDLAEPEWEVFI